MAYLRGALFATLILNILQGEEAHIRGNAQPQFIGAALDGFIFLRRDAHADGALTVGDDWGSRGLAHLLSIGGHVEILAAVKRY